ncbi:MAG: translocation/assembly module TamB domain-containing protein [Proteobacteria bacterium]|nr:translocation/assembly module TamB domain-containing protein [Pseudomonadota bacterium]
MDRTEKRRSRRWIFRALLGFFLLLAIGVGVLRLRFNGPALAETITAILNNSIRGRVQVESVEWPLRSLPVVITGGWLPVTVRGLKVYDDGGSPAQRVDDGQRELLLETDLAIAYIDAHSLMFGDHDFIIKYLEAPNGGYVFLKEVREPYPLHEYDTHVVSLASAFFSYLKPGFRSGITAYSAPIFDIRHFKGHNITVEVLYPLAHVIVEGVDGEGVAQSDYSDPLKEKAYYSLTPTAIRGVACVGDVWPEERKRLGTMYPPRPPGAGPEYDYRKSAELCRGRGALRPPSEDEFDTIYAIPLIDIEVGKLAQLPMGWPRDSVAHDVEWEATGQTPDGARLGLSGALRDWWVGFYGGDYDGVVATVENGGSLIHHLSGGLAGGDNLRIELRASGPSIGPKFEVDMTGLDIEVPIGQRPLNLHLKQARTIFDMVTEEGSLVDTVAFGADGEIALAATFAIDPFRFDIQADITKPLTVAEYLPKPVRQIAGQRLNGRLHLYGSGDRYKLDRLNLWLGRARMSGELSYDDSDNEVRVSRFNVRVGESEISSNGRYRPVDGMIKLGVRLSSTDLGRWLGQLDVPALATGVEGRAVVTGTLDTPVAQAQVTVSGIPIARSMDARLRLADDELTIQKAESYALGGRISAQGQVHVGRKLRLDNVTARARGLDLSKIPGFGDALAGRMDIVARASGPIDAINSLVDVGVKELEIAGDPYEQLHSGLCADNRPAKERGDRRPGPQAERYTLRTLPGGRKELRLCLSRKSGTGGSLQARAGVDRDGSVDGKLRIEHVPLHDLRALGGAEQSPLGGLISAALDLGGNTDAPHASGQVSWLDSWLGDAFLGAGAVDVSLLGPDQIGIKGELLQGDVELSAAIHTVAPYDSEVHIKLRRVGLDRFAPDLIKTLGVAMWITGELDIHTTLVSAPGRPPTARIVISELEVWKDNDDSRGRPAPLRLRNKASTPIAIAYDGKTATIENDVILVGPGGAEFVLSGRGSLDQLAVTLDGDIAVSLFEPYMRDLFNSMNGTLTVSARVTGSARDPEVDVAIAVTETVVLQPAGQDSEISLSGGLIRVTNDQITPTGLQIVVRDPYTGESATLEVKGSVKMDDFEPKRLALIVDGELAGKLLVVVAPEYFSRASGIAQLQLAVRGDPRLPRLDGDLTFEEEQPLSLALRGLRHEIRLTGGGILFTDESIRLAGNDVRPAPSRSAANGQSRVEIKLNNLVGTIADEGQITDLSGEITLIDWQPDSVDLTVSADSLPFRVPKQLDLTVNIVGLGIVGNADDGIYIGRADSPGRAGVVEVVDGRYTRNFNLITDVLQPEASDDTNPPFYQNVPLLADAQLDMVIETRGFFVDNNVAKIELGGEVKVSGTLREPKFDGDINVEEGEFTLPGIRARFTRTKGSVLFSGFKKFPDDTPILDLKSESDYRDPSGQEHLITLSVGGTLNALKWDLFTSSGLNKGQTIVLITSGRTPDEFRQSLGDTSPGLTDNRVELSTDPNEGAADEILRELASDFISMYIGDKLRNITNLDVARLEIGTGSIGFHGEIEFFKNLRVLGDIEQTLRGRTWNVRSELRLFDPLSLEGVYLNKDFGDDSEEDFSDLSLRAVLRFFIP